MLHGHRPTQPPTQIPTQPPTLIPSRPPTLVHFTKAHDVTVLSKKKGTLLEQKINRGCIGHGLASPCSKKTVTVGTHILFPLHYSLTSLSGQGPFAPDSCIYRKR